MLPEKVSLQLSSEQSLGDVRITELDWKRVHRRRPTAAKVLLPKLHSSLGFHESTSESTARVLNQQRDTLLSSVRYGVQTDHSLT